MNALSTSLSPMHLTGIPVPGHVIVDVGTSILVRLVVRELLAINAQILNVTLAPLMQTAIARELHAKQIQLTITWQRIVVTAITDSLVMIRHLRASLAMSIALRAQSQLLPIFSVQFAKQPEGLQLSLILARFTVLKNVQLGMTMQQLLHHVLLLLDQTYSHLSSRPSR
jgi:hypothetical protein